MKKKIAMSLIIAGFTVLAGGYAYGHDGIPCEWEAFRNEAGETVYYPVGVLEENAKRFENANIPENAKIGDVFLGLEGEYERVIAVGEDGAFVTESISDSELE